MIDDENEYTIDSEWLARVKEVVDYCYNENLFVLINVHGDGYNTVDGGWFLVNGEDQNTICEKYEAVWTQIANYFADYDEHLIFESMNEEFDNTYDDPNPDYYANLNKYNQIFVDTVRSTGSNNTHRWLLVPGWNTNIDYTTGDYGFELPTDDSCTAGENRLMVSVHYYDPWDYCGTETGSVYFWGEQGEQIVEDNNFPSGTLPSYGDEEYLKDEMQRLKDTFTSKGIPVIMGEYGAIDKSYANADLSDMISSNRIYFNACVAGTAVQYGVIPIYWDNGVNSKYGFGVFNRNTCEQTQPELIKAIIQAVENQDPTAGANVEVSSKKSSKSSAVHAYIGIQTEKYTFRNSYADPDYGHDSEYFNTLIAWSDDNEIIDTGATFEDADITQDGDYTVSVSGYDFSQDGGLNMLFISTDFDYYNTMRVKNVVLKCDDKEYPIDNPAVMADDNGKLYIDIVNKYNTDLSALDFDMPTNSFSVSFTISGTSSVISEDTEDTSDNSSVNAYIGLQTSKYTFRNSYSDTSYGFNTEYFNTLIAWSDDNEIIDTGATFEDAKITKDGDYTVSVSGYDFSQDGSFNMLFVSTDFPYYDNITIKNVVLTCDDNTYEIPRPVVSADDNGNLYFEIINIYNTELASIDGLEMPTNSISISFNITGTDSVISSSEDSAETEEETVAETEAEVTESTEETTPEVTDKATTTVASTTTEKKSSGGTVVIVIIVIVVVVGAVVVINNKKKNRYY
jgi:endoglucanase